MFRLINPVEMRYVIALGGNALKADIMKGVADRIADLYVHGNKILISHGNGPQVGELAVLEDKSLAILTAQTQAEMGLSIQERTQDALSRRLGSRTAQNTAVMLTRVVVDLKDKEFKNPTKPIGKFYTAKEAVALAKKGLVIKHLINGYRRVVPSPIPRQVVESPLIYRLLNENLIVIAGGGGGIAVSYKRNKMEHMDAVIDKDRTSSLLARQIKADMFVILTNVEGAYLNFKKRSQKLIRKIRVEELNNYLQNGEFEEGSMKPKVEACLEFIRKTGKIAVIGSISNPEDAFNLKTTVIEP